MEYRVELDVYNGPLDLLLYLIKRDELDIYDIPIARITESYMQYVNMLKDISREHGLDINVVGDFMVMAATLMEIKSAMLLPKPPPTEDGQPSAAQELADPRYELVQQLLQYKRFKDSARLLQQMQQQQQNRFPRAPVRPDLPADQPPPIDLDEVQVWDLLQAFSRLMKEVGGRLAVHEITYDDTPLELHAADIEDLLQRQGRLTLSGLLLGRRSRSEMIGLFLALLELIRQKKVIVRPSQVPDEIDIEPAPPQHQMQAQPPLHLVQDDPPAATQQPDHADESV